MKAFDVRVHPVQELSGELFAQPSKNYTTRYLIAAALSEGETLVKGVATSEDSQALQQCLRTWGATLTPEAGNLRITGFGAQPKTAQTLNPLNAGAVARFLMALAALTTHTRFETEFVDSLGKRPHGDLLAALEHLGAKTTSNEGKLPIDIYGSIQGGAVTVSANLSSQYTSGLIFLAPLLPEGLTITLTGDIKSPAPIRQTLDTLHTFGIVSRASEDLREIRIAGKQRYHAPEVQVPGDYPGSSALIAASVLKGKNVVLHNLREHDLQGERLSVDVLQQMGANIRREGDSLYISGGTPLTAITTDGDRFTDAVQALSAAACFAQGTTNWENVYTLRLKECDRISDTRAELLKLGIVASETENSLSITGQETVAGGITVHGHGDHRMIMMLTLIGLNAQQPIVITGAEHIRKSYPEFFHHLERLGAKFDYLPQDH